MEEIKNETNAEGQPDKKVVVQISLLREGGVIVESAFLGDEMAMYGILKKAEKEVEKFHAPKIIPTVNGGFRNFIKNGR